ncbi:DUF4260 family protein [Streptomyces sp. DSM 15324]|uniref:DUF4260 family protein n=1 Tax=Streptomyces sp. DSM 15324 TaxID=1739111 RepID=UPI00074875B4|nr:DUF4260 family protein [Streptomyces sp. DSM 15324]KUO13080.1 hypothetical protein AQJ58_04095 [Streptomyces sp. DSM 15324]
MSTATSTPTSSRTSSPLRLLRRTAWLGAALFWTAFAVLEGVNHGWLAGAAAVAFFIAPDLTFLVAVDEAPRMAKGQLPPRAVPYYNALHRALVPFALLVAYAVGPVAWPPFFAALCGWLAHISYDRAFGYGLRTKEGFQRGTDHERGTGEGFRRD